MTTTNAAEFPATGALQPKIEFVRIKSRGVLTKTYIVGPDGRPAKAGEPNLCYGTAYRVALNPANLAHDFGHLLEQFGSHEALAAGQLADPRDEVPLTTKDRAASTPESIARTKGWATYAEGMPALVCFDHDAKDLQPELQAKIAAAGGFENYLLQLFPEMASATRVLRPSVSTGIRNRETGALTQGGGLHLYMFVKDGGDARDFKKRVHDRMLLAGDGYALVTKSGSVLIRSAIDLAASCDPGWLVFEGPAICADPRLEHVPGARAVTIHDGGLLDTKAVLPPLTVEEQAAVRQIEAELRASVKAEADAIRAERGNVLAGRHVGNARQAGSTMGAYRFGDDGEPTTLFGSCPIHLDDGAVVTVADVLLEPERFHEKTCADPLEPEYGGGRNKAIIYTDRILPFIYSHAHGGQRYELRLTSDEFRAIVNSVEAAYVVA
jgi:hypothetical protein